MYCKNCGSHIPDDARFCTKCGADQKITYTPAAQRTAVRPAPGATSVLIFGILSLALSLLGYSSIGGIICGILCRVKAREYTEAGGELTGKAGTGKTLGQIGLIVSIVMLVLSVLVTVFYILVYLGFMAWLVPYFTEIYNYNV